MPSLQMSSADAKPLLAPHLASGRALSVAACLVGDADDFGVWIWRCRDWRTHLANVLRYIYGAESARLFEQATKAAPGGTGWQAAVNEEVESVQLTVETLEELYRELGEQDAGDRKAPGHSEPPTPWREDPPAAAKSTPFEVPPSPSPAPVLADLSET